MVCSDTFCVQYRSWCSHLRSLSPVPTGIYNNFSGFTHPCHWKGDPEPHRVVFMCQHTQTGEWAKNHSPHSWFTPSKMAKQLQYSLSTQCFWTHKIIHGIHLPHQHKVLFVFDRDLVQQSYSCWSLKDEVSPCTVCWFMARFDLSIIVNFK